MERPLGSDAEEWRQYIESKRDYLDGFEIGCLADDISAAINAAVAREREACAEIAENEVKAYAVALIIRARGNP